MLLTTLVASDPANVIERGATYRAVVTAYDQNGVLVTTLSSLAVKFTSPLGTTIGPFTLAGAQVVAGSGAQGGSNAPLGSWYYDLDTALTANKLSGYWKGTWTSTGPKAETSFGFQVIDNYAP